jgi:hypothetical protein
MGLSCAVETNSSGVLAATRSTFRQAIPPGTAADLTLRFSIDGDSKGLSPWPQAYFRGLSHLVYGQFDSASAFVLDLSRRRALGRFTTGLATHTAFWQRAILPNAIGLMSEALGLTALHCASVEKDGAGLLIAGGAGAGKSTLSLALARRGFAFLSDDWTYLTQTNGMLRARHIATPLKLLPDAVQFFPELRSLQPHVSLNGEVAYEVDPERVFGIRRSFECEPRWLVFVERRSGPAYRLTRIAPAEGAARLESELEELPSALGSVTRMRSMIVTEVAGRECWLLEHGESPDSVAHVLEQLCSSSGAGQPGLMDRGPAMPFRRSGPDILRRFTPTPITANFQAGSDGDAIALETDSPAILQHASDILRPADIGRTPQFLWRLIADPVAGVKLDPGASGGPPESSVTRLDRGLHLESLGPGSFFIVDAEARLAIGFFQEALVNDAHRFRHVIARLAAVTIAARAVSQ